jgi:transcriptional regulator with XRE-family HTH domain
VTQVVHPLDTYVEPSPLAEARTGRGLSVPQVALRSGLSVQEIEWLEEGRLYRFPSQSAAITAAVVYATALGIDRREARKLAGLPVAGGPFRVNPVARMVGAAALAALLSVLAVMVLVPGMRGQETRTVVAAADPTLPPPWKIGVTVLNGSGDIDWTRRLASRIGAMAYRIKKVGPADRFDYPQTTVWYQPGGSKVAVRLARQLGVVARPLPGGTQPLQLVVIAGPERGPGG